MFMEQQNPFYLGAKAAIRFKAALVAASSIYWIYRQRVEVQTYAQVNSYTYFTLVSFLNLARMLLLTNLEFTLYTLQLYIDFYGT